MRTEMTVFGHFAITVECSCAGPEHGDRCEVEEHKYQAADDALKGGVSVTYDDFVERIEV